MRILIEEHQYEVADVKDVLYGIDALENVQGKVSIHYVGYYYNTLLKDCVFILPKVLLKGETEELVFGKYRPEDIVNLNEKNPLEPVEQDFIYKFAVWIYRAIVVYKNSKNSESQIIYHAKIAQIGNARRRLSNTYLDILLSLLQFNKDNKSFFFTIVKNMHSGFNKINWTKTIAHTTAIVQEGNPFYLNPVNKKRVLNFDEELLVIFFSILNYIADKYGFPRDLECQFDLITGKKFDTYLHGFGKTRLHQIKYKYFSDKALQLWQLCYAFFDEAKQIFITTEQKEYLLVKNFYIVFEAIIDDLISDYPLPDGMDKKQEDGKIVDHLFTAQSLIDSEAKQTYYIGDSKYYKMGHELGSESVYKQYTYARNVIQWNLDIFNIGDKAHSGIQLRDDLTEGYNIIPNFFISAKMDEKFDYNNDGISKTNRKEFSRKNIQFKNRLFDRDTLLLFHYDVNFLFILSLYARDNANQKQQWKNKIRDKFRTEVQLALANEYEFFAMKAHPGVNGAEYICKHFKELLGKVYTPFNDKTIYSLALDAAPENSKHNKRLRETLSKFFYVVKCDLGHDPNEVLPAETNVDSVGVSSAKQGVLMVMMENFVNKCKNFLPNGSIAIGIKMTKTSMKIIENIAEIGYVLFHTRKDEGQHLFAITSELKVVYSDEFSSDIYRDAKKRDMYILVRLNSNELNSSNLHSSQIEHNIDGFPRNTFRYDAQFVRMEELMDF